MPKAQALQVIERSSARRLRAEVSYGTGLEAILALRVLATASARETFERGEEIARAQKRGLPAPVTRALTRLRTGQGDAWSCLLAMVASQSAPHDLDSVIGRLKAMSDGSFKSAFVSALAELNPDDVRAIERIQAGELHGLVIGALRALPAELYGGSTTAELLERNASDAERMLAESSTVEMAIERLTRGFVYRPEAGVTSIVLVPSLVHRPWALVVDHGSRKVICYPARTEAELASPDLALVAIYRALGDGTRLRILRRLASGPASVARMSEQLGLAKSTVHEHLESLRGAGLVRLPASGGFELVPELPDLNWMLKEFLGLEMRGQCETCATQLEADGVAYICSYECTFCGDCAHDHGMTCPNCAGELVLRPRRVKKAAGRRHRGALR